MTEELYALDHDPLEVNNLAADPAYGPIKQELVQQLLKELSSTRDPIITGNMPPMPEKPKFFRY